MKKQIIIHFGPPKTGTSAIQGWFNKNRELLETHGFFYPEHSVDANGISSGNLVTIYNTKSKPYKLDNKKVAKLLNQFEHSSCHTLVLSSEFFHFVLDELYGVFTTAKFIGYVRDPIEFTESMYNQSVKRHAEVDKMPTPDKFKVPVVNKLILWFEELGKKRISLRAYAPKRFVNNDIVSDFCEAIGFDGYQENQLTHINSSYCFEALEFMRWVNQYQLGDIAPQLDLLLQKYQGAINEFTLIPDELLQSYYEFSVKRLNQLNRKLKIVNFDLLKDEMSVGVDKPFYSQDISNEQFENVCSYLNEERPDLYEYLCRHIDKYVSKHRKVERYELVKLMQPFRKKASFIRRVYNAIKPTS